MAKGKSNKRGATPPQQGRIVRASSSPADVTAGQAPKVDTGGAPGMKSVRAGAPPNDVRVGPGSSANVAEANVRKGSDPSVPGMNHGLPSNVKGGAAPTGNMGGQGGKLSTDNADDQMNTGRRYKKGGKVAGKLDADGDNDNVYAKGGKVTRNSPVGEASLKGNAGIPLAQPGGTPSTGVTASGSMLASSETPEIAPGSLRVPTVKRAGKAPSLMRPPR